MDEYHRYDDDPPATDGTGGGIPADQRNMAALCHLASFVGLLGVPAIVGPLVVWLLKRQEMPFVDQHGKEAVNFQITVLIGLVVSAILFLVLIGFLTLLIILLVDFLCTIIAAIKASNGEDYRTPSPSASSGEALG